LPVTWGQALAEVDVLDPKSEQLAMPDASVEQDEQDRRVSAIGEVPAFGGSEQLLEVRDGDDRDGGVGDPRSLHPLHRRAFDLLLLQRPAPELLQRPELHREGRRFHRRATSCDVGLDMLAPNGSRGGWHPVGCEVADQRIEGGQVDSCRLGRACGVEVQAERLT
jgi:hypothetical protein